MEYEKTYLPLVLQKKKNYVGVKYEMDSTRWKLDFKGIAVKRRDSCNFTKEVFWSVIYPSLGLQETVTTGGKTKVAKASFSLEQGPDAAIKALRIKLDKLAKGTIDTEDLYIYKSIKSEYKGPDCPLCCGSGKGFEDGKECSKCFGRGKIINLPHVQLADRMRKRDPGSAPVSGQRFPYIVVHEDQRSLDLNQCTEDPAYARRMGIPPDYIWYLNNQVRKPVSKFLRIVGKEDATDKEFAKTEARLYEIRARRRREKADAVKMVFFDKSNKRPGAVVPLKPPKKRTTTLAEQSKSSKKITDFFKK